MRFFFNSENLDNGQCQSGLTYAIGIYSSIHAMWTASNVGLDDAIVFMECISILQSWGQSNTFSLWQVLRHFIAIVFTIYFAPFNYNHIDVLAIWSHDGHWQWHTVLIITHCAYLKALCTIFVYFCEMLPIEHIMY